MALPRGTASIEDAFEQGRSHTQRLIKSAVAASGARWTDWAFASGQPAYDPRIGTALAFVPQRASANEHIYAGQFTSEKHLLSATLRADGAGGPISVLLFDLLGYYPLIDGDSTEYQPLDNTLPLPRCTDGTGVLPVLVSSVAPAIVTSTAVISYTDANGVQRTSPPFGVATGSSPGQVLNTPSSAATSTGGIGIPLSGSIYGVRSVSGIQYTTAPGGLQCLYLVRPITTFTCNGNQYLATERFFPNSPALPDGCALNLFFYQQTSASTSFFGHLTFID